MSSKINKYLAYGAKGRPANNLAALAQAAAARPDLAGLALKGAANSVDWKTFTAGAVTALVGPAIAKPILFPILKAGTSARLFWRDAREEAVAEKEAVKAFRAANTVSAADVAALRAEVAELKAKLATANA